RVRHRGGDAAPPGELAPSDHADAAAGNVLRDLTAEEDREVRPGGRSPPARWSAARHTIAASVMPAATAARATTSQVTFDVRKTRRIVCHCAARAWATKREPAIAATGPRAHQSRVRSFVVTASGR